MKVYVDSDELYPYYFLSTEEWTDRKNGIDIPDAEYNSYCKFCADFNSWQDKISKLSKDLKRAAQNKDREAQGLPPLYWSD